MDVRMIVAMGRDGAIGRKGDLIWKIPADLKRFKALTTGNPVIMGRKTWESLPKRPLPHRRNIILTRQKDFTAEGAETVSSVEDALGLIGDTPAFVIGGAEIYKAFMPYYSHLYLTMVEEGCDDADAFLDIDLSKGWDLIESSEQNYTSEGLPFRYLTFKRI